MHTSEDEPFRKIFTALSLALLLFSVGITFLFNFSDEWQLQGWGITLERFMLFYLLFVIARSSIFLLFSMLEYANERSLTEPNFYPLVSIIVPCFNEEKVIAKAINSLLELNYPNYEVLIVDDGSFDMTTTIAKEFEDKHLLRVIFQENAGKAAALNRGISEAVGDYVLCMDADSILNKNVLMYAMPYFERDSRLASVAGAVHVENTKNCTLTNFQKLEYVVGLNFHKKAQSFLNLVTIVPGPIGVFKKSAIEKIGGYHTDTFAEDCDLSMRLLVKGYNIKYCSRMISVSQAPADLHSLMVQRYRWTRGMIQAIIKNSKWLSLRHFHFRNFMIVSYMLGETVFIPAINYIFATATITYSLTHSSVQIYGPYFLGLLILDVTLSLYSVVFERKITSLFFLAMINRFTYGLMLEVLRFFSIFDEMFRIPMKWGVIPRRGEKG